MYKTKNHVNFPRGVTEIMYKMKNHVKLRLILPKFLKFGKVTANFTKILKKNILFEVF